MEFVGNWTGWVATKDIRDFEDYYAEYKDVVPYKVPSAPAQAKAATGGKKAMAAAAAAKKKRVGAQRASAAAKNAQYAEFVALFHAEFHQTTNQLGQTDA